ncbi:hypothetical protein [Geothrix limicola]|uniref:hypothetical protein n=1 Tax=Geothrix limicola TaxID=2927978 RepID=UPI0025574FDF|nr:hypothetical protein [Geothrix limicola]
MPNSAPTTLFAIPKYKARLVSKSESTPSIIDSISLSFPFGISVSFKPSDAESQIAGSIIVKVINRRILNGRECCASCINESIQCLKEIKSDLVAEELRLIKAINTPLFYLTDYIITSINAFNDFMERNRLIDGENINIYFDALNKLRCHIAKCLTEIAKIASIEIAKDKFASIEGGPSWNKDSYSSAQGYTVDIVI